MSDKQEAVFVSGLYLNRVHEKAPAFVITNQDIHVDKLIDWLQENKKLANEKGYIRIQGKESDKKKDAKGNNVRYFQVDTYKPEQKQNDLPTKPADTALAPKYPEEEIDPLDIPF